MTLQFPSRGVALLARLGLCALAAVLLTVPLGSQSALGVHNDLQTYMASRMAPYSTANSFSFGVYSDIHMIENQNYGLTRAQWQRLVTRWRDDNNLFGMIVGDLGYGSATDIDNVLSGPATVPNAPPVIFTMGNHELDGVGKRAWIDALFPGAVQVGSWSVVPQLAPGNADLAYYSFNVGPLTHFIVLDGDYMSFDGLNSRARQSFGQSQLTWLTADIRANPDKNILVFIHEPIDQQLSGSTPYYELTDRGGLIDLLAAHPKQAFVFSGHFHSFSGVTRWRGITSVHVMTGQDPFFGIRVTVNGDQITLTGAGTANVNDFDQHPMNKVVRENDLYVQRVAEDGSNAGFTRGPQMTAVGAENGVMPVAGSLMLKSTAMTWLSPRFISEQLIKIQPGMKFSYDIFLLDVVGNNDAVTVQPGWSMKDGSMPAAILDQNGLRLSRRTTDNIFFMYNEDVPLLGGRATGRWYHRDFDLTPLAGHYVDGLSLTSEATHVNVGTIYVDNIRFTWPAPLSNNSAPSVALTSPSSGPAGVELATINVAAVASDDGSIARVDFFANSAKIGSRTAAPYSLVWTGVAPGAYSITAVATDNLAAATTSAPVAVSVEYAPSGPPQSVFTGQVPAGTYTSSGNFELGMRFISGVGGRIQSIRFWKAAGETGTHIGRVWNAAGQQLASVTFVGETSSGWQQQALATPLLIDPNTEYLVSVNTTNTLFVATNNAFATDIVSGSLRAMASTNGRYGSVGSYPLTTYANTNYFRDIVFVPRTSIGDTVPPAVTLTLPANGATVAGSTTLNASTFDNIGVAGVRFQLDGVTLGAEVTSPPYSMNWTTTGVSNGLHALKALVRDLAGNIGMTTIAVTVANGTGAPQTLFTSQVPADINVSSLNYELGVRVFSDIPGQIIALRFWKLAGETGGHVGRVWNGSGQLVATVTFANETASGWQQQSLALPLEIQANAPYVVSVNTTSNLFPASVSTLTTELVQGNLHAPVGPNGVYGAVNTYPAVTYANTNYFRDLVFVPGGGGTDTLAPTITLTQPTVGSSVTGSSNLSADAADNTGVVSVQFKVDGQNIGSEVTRPPYAVPWTTTGVADGSHTVSATARDGAGNSKTDSVIVTVANGASQQTLLTTQVPGGTYASSVDFELGVRVVSTMAGTIRALRYWKAAGETGTHVGRVWSATGTLLATVVFTGETASGWQQQALTSPLVVAANTEYLMSVNSTNNLFAATLNGFDGGLVNGVLRAVAGSNGRYGVPGQYPTATYLGANYFRDLVFIPNGN